MLEKLSNELAASRQLSDAEIRLAVGQLVEASVAISTKADFLWRLALKGETADEIFSFARALRERAIEPPLDAATRQREILDVCGTGGDRLNTFNISTTVALVCAAAGIPVAKHGNRAITSLSGSADVLEALGIRVDLAPGEAARSLREHNFAFFFAPNYHPAFKHIAPARKLCAERGQRTIFNFLGPLLNPAHPSVQLVGVLRPELAEPMARVLQRLGVRRAMVVCGRVPDLGNTGGEPPAAGRFLDELSTLGANTIVEFYQERGLASSVLEPEGFPMQPATLEDLAGGDRQTNAGIVRRLLNGEDRGPKRDAVLLNAAAALLVAGQVRSLSEGWDQAGELIDGGAANNKLKELGG